MTTQGPVRSEPEENVQPPLPPPATAAHLPVGATPPPRIGRSERDAADARLREALRDDVITITEYDERLGLVLGARTQQDLDAILADLPTPPPTAGEPPTPPVPECSAVTAVMTTEEQRGRWRPARPLRAVATMGTAVVDLRDAVPTDGGFEIDAKAVMGRVDVVVPDNAVVEVAGFAVMGEKKNTVAPPTVAGGPRVTVNGHAVMGTVEVRTATRRERKRHPVSQPSQPPRGAARANAPVKRRAGTVGDWTGRVIGVGILLLLVLGPGRAVAGADAVAVFGSRQYQPDVAQLEGDDDIDVLSMFGSVEIVIPQTHRARSDVLPLFGSTDCEEACAVSSDAPTIQVDGAVLFGSAEIRHPATELE